MFMAMQLLIECHFFFQNQADCSDMLHEVAADFVCNSLYTSEVCTQCR